MDATRCGTCGTRTQLMWIAAAKAGGNGRRVWDKAWLCPKCEPFWPPPQELPLWGHLCQIPVSFLVGVVVLFGLPYYAIKKRLRL